MDVIYMAYGVKICGATDYNEYGVVLNFNIFSGDEMLEKICEYSSPTSTGIPDSNETSVIGFLSAVSRSSK